MAGRISWSDNAKADLKQILLYWKQRNQSSAYPRKLRKHILSATEHLLQHLYSGACIAGSEVRKKSVKDYLVVYEIVPDGIAILAIFDTRQHQDKLNIIVK